MFHRLTIRKRSSVQDFAYWHGIADTIGYDAISNAFERAVRQFHDAFEERCERTEEPSWKIDLDGMLASQDVGRNIDHLVFREDVVAAHIVALPVRAWIVEYAAEIVDHVGNGDVTHPLLTAAKQTDAD